jgi:hypothetical protein
MWEIVARLIMAFFKVALIIMVGAALTALGGWLLADDPGVITGLIGGVSGIAGLLVLSVSFSYLLVEMMAEGTKVGMERFEEAK